MVDRTAIRFELTSDRMDYCGRAPDQQETYYLRCEPAMPDTWDRGTVQRSASVHTDQPAPHHNDLVLMEMRADKRRYSECFVALEQGHRIRRPPSFRPNPEIQATPPRTHVEKDPSDWSSTLLASLPGNQLPRLATRHHSSSSLSASRGSAAPDALCMPSAAAPMGIYERRHHHPLADASGAGGIGGVWADPFRYMASAPGCSSSSTSAPAAHGMELLAEPKFEPALHPMVGVEALAQLPPSPEPDSSDGQEPARPGHKNQRRLAQNREAARKSRLRKKAYIQNLETSRMKLARMEQELNRARQQQQLLYAGASSSSNSPVGLPLAASFDPGVAAFEVEYARWVEEQSRQTRELRAALEQQQPDAPEHRLRALAEAGLEHYDRMFRAKSAAAHSDVFFVMSGVWRPAVERFFLWIAGFRPSDLLKVLAPQLEPLTEEQQAEVGRLRQTARQAEDALSQGMDKLRQSLAESLLLSTVAVEGEEGLDGGAGYVGRRMASAMGRLKELAGFVEQADHLRQQTLRNMYRILTARQAVVGLLALGDYSQRLQAVSKLWAARPREPV